VDADLTDNVAAYIRVMNERDWGRTSYDDQTVDVELAYITIQDIWGYPVTARFGRQEIKFGEGFLVGDGYNYARQQNIAPTATEENSSEVVFPLSRNSQTLYYNKSWRKAFDALRFTVDYDPYTFDLFTAKIDEGAYANADDTDLYGAVLHYDYMDIGQYELGVYLENGDNDREIWAVSLRGESEVPAFPGLVLKGEIVPEFGDAAEDVDQDALGWYFGAYYFFENEYEPYVGAEYIVMEGDDNLTDDENEVFYPFYEDEVYGEINEVASWGLNTNLNIIKVAAGFKPTETIAIDFKYYNLQLDEEDSYTYGEATTNDDDLGDEYDLYVTYDYSEDLQFGLCVAYFDSGDVLEDVTGDDNEALQVVGSVKVSF